ncbi:hypothetical protein [Brevibacterium oceani]|uniref:hypothetical protein n=1 Tax=Brevibacterium oceani TaxID=358099 RepID=UPI0015E70FAF|nr:hypothetical protein [Brevibacterium oceani]
MSLYRTVEWTIDSAFEPTDCETCGPSYEELNVSWDGYKFHANYRVGCYGGASAYDMNITLLVEWLGQLPDGFIAASDERELLDEVHREWKSNNP